MSRFLSKSASLMTSIIILVSISFVAFKVEASGAVYIRADGSIDPPDAPISTVDNVTYTLTGDVTSDADGIVVERSNIIVDGNGYTLEGTRAYDSKGIYLSGNGNITIRNSKVKGFYYGFRLDYSSNNTISENDIENNEFGMQLFGALNNKICENGMVNNTLALWLGYSSNTLISKSNIEASTLGGIYLGGSSNNTIAGNKIVGSFNFGIRFAASSNDNIILENNITNNKWGIELLESSARSRISGNRIESNEIGVRVHNDSSNNAFCHNTIIGNFQQVYDYAWEYPYVSPSTNVWDDGYPSGGNYWSDCNATDSDYDGIGDNPYLIDATNQDNYPLMGIFSGLNTSYGYAVDFVSNSSISNFSFNLSLIEVYPPEAILTFDISGETGTEGFLRICIPKILINGSYVIRFDGEIITNTTYPQVRELPCSNETYEYLYINYTHSEHTIVITGTTIIPEFPTWTSMLLILILLTVAITIFKRRLLKTPIH